MKSKIKASHGARVEMIKSRSNVAKIGIAEEIIKGMINGGLSPKGFAIAMNNAFIHGEVLVDNDFTVGNNDELLQQWYDHIDAMSKIGEKMDA